MTLTQIVPTSSLNAMPLVPGPGMSMTSVEIADLVESRHDNVRVAIQRLAEKGVITLPAMQEKPTAGRPTQVYVFAGEQGKRDSIIVVAQLSPEFTARLVDRWQELEAKQAVALPNFANPADAARAWAEQYEARQIAERTKAEIGSRREATAMNTASQAVKHANKLEIELDRSKQYATVKRMEMLYQGVKFNWRLLKSTSIQMDMPPIDVFDQNYGTVKAYHADVWRESYALEIEVS
ncbi:hypothetical protein PT7_P072 (plasmid) [Pusillimonas sp. T7-7]|nr:hypothetical protein PT7_P072 [Pusillimonas sp. T7-7]